MSAGSPAEVLQRASAHVARHGDDLAVRQAAALAGEAPASSLVERLEPAADVPSALALLSRLDDVRALHVPAAEQTIAYLEGVQGPDGAWLDVFHTGMLAGFLSRSLAARQTTLYAAGAYLASQWSPDAVKTRDWRPIAAFAHFYANVPDDNADAALQWCGRELDRGYRTGVYDAVRVARVLVWCDALAIPGAQLTAGELLEVIRAEQAEDGGWGGVERTLDAMVALARFA